MNKAHNAFEKTYKEQQNSHNNQVQIDAESIRLDELNQLRKVNPDHLRQTVNDHELESFKKAHAYLAWKKDQVKRASLIFLGLIIAILLLGFNYGNIVTAENGLGFVIPAIMFTLFIFALFYLYVLAIWWFNHNAERRNGILRNMKIKNKLYLVFANISH